MSNNCWPHLGEKKIKALVVIAEKKVIKVGDLTIPAPIGVGVDPTTGELTAPVRLKAIGEPVLRPKILRNLLINQGFLKAKLIVENNDPDPCPDVRKGICMNVIIPIQKVIKIKGIRPGDHIQEDVKIKSLSVFAIPEPIEKGVAGTRVKLVLKVVLKVKIVIAREKIICVPVKKRPCKDDGKDCDFDGYDDDHDDDYDDHNDNCCDVFFV